MSLLQVGEDCVAERLDRRHRKQAAEPSEFREQCPMFEDMLDLSGEIKGQQRELFVQCACNPQGMGWAVQEVGVAERNMLGPQLHQTPDIFQNNLLRNREEPATIDRWNRTM